MTDTRFRFPSSKPLVVGSFGDIHSLREATPESLSNECDLAEIRLDLFAEVVHLEKNDLWKHLSPFPLLFTARRFSEGSPVNLDQKNREELLRLTLPDAAMIDIELASYEEMSKLISDIAAQNIPWIASYHDFARLPQQAVMETAAKKAAAAGAAVFKIAGKLGSIESLTALANFQMADSGIPISSMGMGALAPVSRLLCAQSGSLLNYGYIGSKPTAPGQWSARRLKECIESLSPLPTHQA